MILSRQSFPGDIKSVDLKADNDVAISTPLPSDTGTPKATVTPPMDVAGKPDTAPQVSKEKTTPGTVAPICAQEPLLPQKERDKHAADRKRESQGRADLGNFHTADSHDPAPKQECRKKRHHHPAKNGKTPQRAYKLGNGSKPDHRHAADETGNYGKQTTPAARRRNCKPQPIQDRNSQSHRENASGKSCESHGQEETATSASHIGSSPSQSNRARQGYEQKNKDHDIPGMHPHGKRTTVGTQQNDSLSKHRHSVDATGNKATCKTLAEKRGKHAPQQITVSNTPRTTKGRNNQSAGRKPWSKDVQKGTGKKNTPGGHQQYANSQHRNVPARKVYDPLIGRHPIPVCNCMNLMEHIVADQNFLTALRKVNSEPNKAAGYDRRKVREVCGPLLASPERREEVRRALLDGSYNPAPVRTVLIPKKNGKMRVLGIGTVLDRIVQTMILQAVPGFLPENPWSPFSFAYQAGLGVSNAIAEVNNIREEGYSFCITLDLSAFFDNVPHDRLLGKLKVHLKDPRVIGLVGKFLTSVIADPNGELKRNRIGTPQGSVLSPWLASEVYLHELDMELTQRGHRFVRYADDITVFCHSRSAAKRIKARLIQFIEDTMKCPVNREKTKIVDIRKLAVLGVYLDNGHWHIQRDKEIEACGCFLRSLESYSKSKGKEVLEEAVARIDGFLQHYKRIPGLDRKEVKDIARWCTKKWRSLLGDPFDNDPETVRMYLQLVIQV